MAATAVARCARRLPALCHVSQSLTWQTGFLQSREEGDLCPFCPGETTGLLSPLCAKWEEPKLCSLLGGHQSSHACTKSRWMNELSSVVTVQSGRQGRFWVHISSQVLSNCPGHLYLRATIPGVRSVIKLEQSQLLCSETSRVGLCSLLIWNLTIYRMEKVGLNWKRLNPSYTPSSSWPFLPNPLPTRPYTLRASAYGVETRDPGRRQT